jgi:hypothetical protein
MAEIRSFALRIGRDAKTSASRTRCNVNDVVDAMMKGSRHRDARRNHVTRSTMLLALVWYIAWRVRWGRRENESSRICCGVLLGRRVVRIDDRDRGVFKWELWWLVPKTGEFNEGGGHGDNTVRCGVSSAGEKHRVEEIDDDSLVVLRIGKDVVLVTDARECEEGFTEVAFSCPVIVGVVCFGDVVEITA